MRAEFLEVEVALQVVQRLVVDLAGPVQADQLGAARRDGGEDDVEMRRDALVALLRRCR